MRLTICSPLHKIKIFSNLLPFVSLDVKSIKVGIDEVQKTREGFALIRKLHLISLAAAAVWNNMYLPIDHLVQCRFFILIFHGPMGVSIFGWGNSSETVPQLPLLATRNPIHTVRFNGTCSTRRFRSYDGRWNSGREHIFSKIKFLGMDGITALSTGHVLVDLIGDSFSIKESLDQTARLPSRWGYRNSNYRWGLRVIKGLQILWMQRSRNRLVAPPSGGIPHAIRWSSW